MVLDLQDHKKGKSKYTLELIKKKIYDIHGDNVKIKDETYSGFKIKATFIHITYGEWEAYPCNIILLRRSHPKTAIEKRKKTLLEKYGVDNYNKLQSAKDNISNIKKNYSKEKKDKINDKRKKSCIEKYGVENVMNNEDIKNKLKNTNIERYGVENVYQSDDIKQKIKETNIEKYGFKSPLQNDEIKSKMKKTTIDRYGGLGLASEQIKNKVKETLELEGIVNVSQRQETKEIIRENNLEKYGVEWYSQTEQFKQQHHNTYLKNNKDKLINNKTQTEISKEYDIPLSSLNGVFRRGFQIDENLLNKMTERDGMSSLERFFSASNNIQFYNKKTTSTGRRADFKLNKTTYINLDGLYWHSDINREKYYHFNLREEYEKDGLRLLQFYESEIYNKLNIVNGIISSINGKNNKEYARKCKIQDISHKEADIFLKENHLMGTFCGKHVALLNKDNDIVMVVTYSIKKNELNIDRLCSKIGISVIGGFSKLLKYIENININNYELIKFWVDLRYGSGKWLNDINFIKIRDVLSFKWVNNNGDIKHRLQIQAKDGKTQKEVAKELGFHKIYDAGQRLYIKRIKEIL